MTSHKSSSKKASGHKRSDKTRLEDRDYLSKPHKSDKSKSDKHRSDRGKSDKHKSDKPSMLVNFDEPRSERTKTDKPRSERTKSDKPRSERTKSDKPRSERTKSDKPKTVKVDKTETQKSDKPKTVKVDKTEPLTVTELPPNNSHEEQTGYLFIYEANGVFYTSLNNIDKADGRLVVIHPVYYAGYSGNMTTEEVVYNQDTDKYITGSEDGSWLDVIYNYPDLVHTMDIPEAITHEGRYYHCDGDLLDFLLGGEPSSVPLL